MSLIPELSEVYHAEMCTSAPVTPQTRPRSTSGSLLQVPEGCFFNGHVVRTHSTNSVHKRKPNLASKLNHVDFWPTCTQRALRACDASFESFEAVVGKANQWLQEFSRFELINCETLNKKVIYVRDILGISSCFTDEDGPILAMDIKGLRLWYRARQTPSSNTPVVLAFVDTLPRYLNPKAKHPKFETMQQTTNKINARLRQHPLPGCILSVETISLKIPQEDWCSTIKVDPCQCHWFDEYNTHQLSFIRIFYAKGQPAHQLIGLQDFTPTTLVEGGLLHPAKYSTLSATVDKAAAWVHKTSGVRVTNIQTLDTKHRKKSENKGQRFNTGKMFEFKIEERFRAYFVRLGYTTVYRDGWVEMPVPHLCTQTYLPLPRKDGYETSSQMLRRIHSDINDEMRPFHVQTIGLPEWMTKADVLDRGDRTFFDGEWYFVADQDGNDHGPFRHTILYAIRVYFDGVCDNPTPSSRPSTTCCPIM